MVVILTGLTCFCLGAALAWLVGVRFAQANQRKHLRRKSALLSGAAQQMRAPLNDVLGLIQTLAFHADDLSSENKERVDAIAGAGANAKAVMLDVLDILDVDAGQTRIKRSVELLPEIADFIERTNRTRAAKAGVKLDIDVKISARAWFLFDVLRLRQCVGAMVRQCVLQSGGGTVSVAIEALEPKKGKKMRRIAVSVVEELERRIAIGSLFVVGVGDDDIVGGSQDHEIVARLLDHRLSGLHRFIAEITLLLRCVEEVQ